MSLAINELANQRPITGVRRPRDTVAVWPNYDRSSEHIRLSVCLISIKQLTFFQTKECFLQFLPFVFCHRLDLFLNGLKD